MTHRRSILAAVAAGTAACLVGFGAASAAASYPSQPVKLVVPFSAGGGGDALGRMIAERLAASLGGDVIVENKPGASTIIGTESVVRSKPDGHTILLNVPLIVQTTALMSKLPYDPIRDLTPVIDVNASALWLAVNPSRIKATDLKGFVAEVRAQPGKHSFGSIGQGSTTHLFGHALKETAQLDLVHVPYKGSSNAVLGAIGGEVSAVILDLVTLKSHADAGKLRLIAVTGTERSKMTPDVATFAEQGFQGFEMLTWAGLFVPSQTPKAIVDRIHSEVAKILGQPDFVAKLASMGYTPGGQSQADFARRVADEKEKWTVMIRSAGVKLD